MRSRDCSLPGGSARQPGQLGGQFGVVVEQIADLALAEPGGFIRIFVDEGAWVAKLLRKMKADGEREKAYIFILLAAFGGNKDRHAPPPVKHGVSPQPLIEPLSEREIEVLQLIAEGLTNQEIATRLYLSLNTVKVHTRNIYSKLDVHHRAQAVARARTLGLLPTSNQ